MGVNPVGEIYKGFIIGKEGEPGRLYSTAYGVYITGEGVFDAPERDGEMITIPGRNGALFKDNGTFKNITLTYKAGMTADNMADFAENIRDFRNILQARALNGYMYIYDDYNAEEFRMGVYKNGLDISSAVYKQAGQFDIIFDCKPQRFLTVGETSYNILTSGTILTNPTAFNALPLISFIMTSTSGSINFQYRTAGDHGAITISNAPTNTRIYIDCELGEAYAFNNGTITPVNNVVDIGAKIPFLDGGSTTINYTGGVSSLQIKPRWWRI